MDDAKETQLQEIEALESIYTSELNVISREYPSICLEISVPLPSNAGGESGGACTLQAAFPADYPNVVPDVNISGLDEKLWAESAVNQLLNDLVIVAQENVGMPMVFTLVSELQDIIGRRWEERLTEAEQREQRQKDIDAIAEQERFEVSRVTVEQFMKWKTAFMEEVAARKDAELKAKEALLANRPTGRQLFLRDDSLNISDLQIMNASDVSGVEIDESLFEDDIDISDDDSD
ncbi:RWD domain-containing protein [Ditylenchus destructor]|uniref:RWD domain-containing protein n=1 Tax=Ditylenchus destructor TaxID=166010 RepID=A0AAD4MZA4_9BILA|nr:RWD domain-containing protein [Ditylenchus destructor]